MGFDRDQIRRLRQLAGAREGCAPVEQAMVPTGHDSMDEALGGGLVRAQLHEIFPGAVGDGASAAALAAILGHRLGGKLVWLREERAERRLRLHAHGLAELGLAPSCLLLGVLPDADAVLRAGADVLRCPGVGVAVIELWGNPRNLGLTGTRRLQLAAEASGVTALLLRIEAEASASAAATRWQVRSIASRPLEGNAPGRPAFELELLKHRGGGRGRWRLEWDRDTAGFRDLGGAALPGTVVSLPADRPLADVVPIRNAG